MPANWRSFTVETTARRSVLTSDVYVEHPIKYEEIPSLSPTHKFVAIWDTGATNSVITQRVVDALNLRAYSMTKVRHATGMSECETFRVCIGLPNKVAFPNIRVTKGDLGPDTDCAVLIGMDIIGSGDFAVTNFEERTVLTFRSPSCERLDFVNQRPSAHSSTVPSAGRNDKCPCGSGLKYKKCHGKGL